MRKAAAFLANRPDVVLGAASALLVVTAIHCDPVVSLTATAAAILLSLVYFLFVE